MQITSDQLRKIAKAKPDAANLNSVQVSINNYGARYGIDLPHRLAHFLAQIMHESGSFKYDREIWGPTPAQKRYDTRTDLGNTKAADGDGKKLAGRGPTQVTGGTNYRAYTKWAKKMDPNAPDFFKTPDALNTDPWEGLSAIWFWDSGNSTGKSLNRYADENNHEMITLRINGGKNGYGDRLDYYDRAALVLLGYGVKDILKFQKEAQKKGWMEKDRKDQKFADGESGPRTRAALHQALLAMSKKSDLPKTVAAAPVVEEKAVEVEVPGEAVAVPVKVSSLEKPWYKTLDGTEKVVTGGLGTTFLAFVTDLPWEKIALFAGIFIAGFIAWYLIRRMHATHQDQEVERIQQANAGDLAPDAK